MTMSTASPSLCPDCAAKADEWLEAIRADVRDMWAMKKSDQELVDAIRGVVQAALVCEKRREALLSLPPSVIGEWVVP